MATVNLGRIKPVFRGAYAGGTAYVVDDIVTHGNETFICIQAGTGNATSNASYWTKLAAKGADGTDVGATLANKEIAFKTNAGAVDGIPIGTAGQFLKVNSGATGYEYGEVSSDCVKLASIDSSSSAGSHNFQSFINDSVYRYYEIHGTYSWASSGSLRARFLNGSTAYSGSSDYNFAGYQAYRRYDNSENHIGSNSDGDGRDYMLIGGWGSITGENYPFVVRIYAHGSTSNDTKHWESKNWGSDNSGGASGQYRYFDHIAGEFQNSATFNGIQFFHSGGNLDLFEASVYGFKK